ncbi:MAG: rsbU 1 [Acidobacteria bacterium]|nr:rsbU 1 [Acidobacteriota bacterium]
MTRVTLRSLIGKQKDAAPVVAALLDALVLPIGIEDADGRLLAGQTVETPEVRLPVTLDGQTLGWVSGPRQAEAVASVLAHLAAKEAEKKTLGNEVLHLYREVNLIYNFSEKLAALLELETVANMTLDQARQMITASDGALTLLDAETGLFETVATFGRGVPCAGGIRWGEGIVGEIAARGSAEIVNDVRADPRCEGERARMSSLICAPLKVGERVTGAIALASTAMVNYTAGDLKLLSTLALQTATAIENARLYERTVQAAKDREQLLALHKELEVASSIQKSILPRDFQPFPDRRDFEIRAEMTPATEVGGDFFDFFLIDADRLGFVIGDVSGKGVPAALFMAVSRTLLKATALRGLPPEQCLEQVNRVLASESVSSMFVTAFYGILDTRTGEVTYCCAGHNLPYLMRSDGHVEAVERSGGTALGVFKKAVFGARRVVLGEGDGLFLYTDGITEAMDAQRNEFTAGRLETSLQKYHDLELEAIIHGVVGDVKTFANGAPQADDMTMVVLRRLSGATTAA